jgi:hypothetical protein
MSEYAFFHQDVATANTTDNSVHCSKSVFSESFVGRELWPHLPDLNMWDFCVWCVLKDIVCSNNLCTEDSLQESVQNIVSAVSPTQL